MSKFAKSAMLPIIIVIVLAFLLSKYMQDGNQREEVRLHRLQRPSSKQGQVKKVLIDPGNNTISVTATDQGKEVKYKIGYVPDAGAQLIRS